MDDLMLRTATPPLQSIWQRSAGHLERSRASESAAPGAGNREALREAAQEFEAIFIGYLLKVMRETIEEAGSSEGGFGKGIYTDLFDQEVARSIARRGVLGIADMIARRPGLGEAETPPEPGRQETGTDPEISDLQLPVQAPVSSRFGMRADPLNGTLRFHKGLDLAAPAGTEVRAALGGEVLFAGFRPGYGNTVLLRHPDGLETRYAHLGEISVRKGEVVESERILGTVGSSGRSTGPHLHFEVVRRGVPLDPQNALAE